MMYHSATAQVLSISCKLKVSQSQAAKLDATLYWQGLTLWLCRRPTHRRLATSACIFILTGANPIGWARCLRAVIVAGKGMQTLTVRI